MDDDYPDDDWEERVLTANGKVREIDPLPEIDRNRIKTHKQAPGQHWIADETLLLCGYEERYVGMIIRVVGRTKTSIFFELDGKVVVNAEDGEEIVGWWVHRVEPQWGVGELEDPGAVCHDMNGS